MSDFLQQEFLSWNPETPPPFWNDWHHFACIFLGRKSYVFQHHVLKRVHGPPPPCHLNELLSRTLNIHRLRLTCTALSKLYPKNWFHERWSADWLLLCYTLFYKCALPLRAYLPSQLSQFVHLTSFSLCPLCLSPSLLPHPLSLSPPVSARAAENVPRLGVIKADKLWPLDCNLIRRTVSYQSRIEHNYHETGILYDTAAWGTVSRAGIAFTLTQQGSKWLILVFWSILTPPGVSTNHVRAQTSEHLPGQLLPTFKYWQ